ncbi:MAG: hypothetical protein AB1798_00055 [Spirochaetota bacterium]
MIEQPKDKDVKAFIFFSVDIVDSSAYKSRFLNDWSKDFKLFLEAFPNKLNESCKSVKIPRHEARPLPCPNIWKLVGDEVLFFIDISETYEKLQDKKELAYYELVLYYTILFRRAIIVHNSAADEKLKKNDRAFKIKGAAWFANIVKGPNYDELYGNIEIEFNNAKADGLKQRDFIGRQIDIGFRIAKHSTLNRFVISVEFAILLLRDNYLTIEDEGIELYYEGRKSIKGILEYVDYPIICIDMEDKFEHYENDLLLRDVTPVNQINLMYFMEEYIKRTNFILYYPFVHDNDRLFKYKPFRHL